MLCRYTRRAQYLRAGLAAVAHGDHEGAELALLALCNDDSGAAFPDLAAEHRFLITYAQILCATALCDDDLHVQSVPLWEKVIEAIDRSTGDSEADDHLLVLGATSYGRFCIETGRWPKPNPGCGVPERVPRRADGDWPPPERSWSGQRRPGWWVTPRRPNAWSIRRIRR